MTRRSPNPGRLAVVVAATGLLASLAATPPVVEGGPSHERAAALVSAPSFAAPAPAPLAGVRIAIDPGHLLGNHNFPAQTNRLVPAGGFEKACNTTGTATNGGFAEATLNFRIARLVQARLEALGARVFLTRTRNSQSLWGPCVDKRGEFGKQ